MTATRDIACSHRTSASSIDNGESALPEHANKQRPQRWAHWERVAEKEQDEGRCELDPAQGSVPCSFARQP